MFSEERKYRRSVLLTAMLGFILGGAFVSALFFRFALPEEPKTAALPPGQPVQVSLTTADGFAVADVMEQVAPAVVSVSNYAYFNQRGRQGLLERGNGSGVVITADGYIVTNYHVVEQADEIAVVFPGSERLQAELVGADPLTDLALLKIERSGLTYLSLGDSSRLRVGEAVFAVGNPLGFFQQSVTAGVISALEREISIQGSDYSYTYIQTDAAINAGNSGGPLVNLSGEIIGINSAKVSSPGVEGIGFAIPSTIVRRVVEDLMAYGYVRRPKLGIYLQSLSRHTGISTDRGVYITRLVAGGPAAKAGLREGDVITAINEKQIAFVAQLYDTLLLYYPGDTVELTVLRDGAAIKVSITLEEMQ